VRHKSLLKYVLFLSLLAALASAQPTDVQPIFKKRCIGCHGAQQQMGGVRLDDRTAAMAGGYAGPIINPGDSSHSVLFQMITTGKDGKVMPPAGAKLTAAEVETIKKWLDTGANWPDVEHVAAIRPKSSHWSLQPITRDATRNSIDSFVLARLEQEHIQPSPQAGRRTLIRRLSLDFTGLLPSPHEIAEFVSDQRADFYERAVDRLLASPHYGEKWARHWLDLARYADSDGYEQDGIRLNAWRYRDWVINALNTNLPFDQFTIQQIAGDLLPGAGINEKAGTAFHRNTLTSREGGIDVEQLRDEQTMDRANTVGTVWLGLTVECARCHDHKYDPISQKDYYQLFAFFNNADEVNITDPVPGEVGPYLQRLPEYEQKIASLKQRLHVDELQAKWEAEIRDAVAHPEARLEWTQVLDYLRVYLDHGLEILMKPPAQRTAKEAHGIMRVFLKSPGPLASSPAMKGLKFDGFKELEDLDAKYPALSEVPVIQESPLHRKSFIHVRGDFRSPGIEVQPGTLSVLSSLPLTRQDRLGLAQWLASPQNPLTPRVTVNRLWQELFGQGLVSTSGDFGTRGEAPSHPELLDWLASELISSGWDVKHVLRLMVNSSTYRQSAKPRDDLATRDPSNRLLARQSRLRLPAELIRDAALSASGLLNTTVGGKSIRPPMPASAMNVAYRARWEETEGPERYRRGLYIFLQRSVPYPLLASFDAPNSLVTCSRRERSTTPLQALTLLNDPVFVEAAQALAARLDREVGSDPAKRIDYAFELCLSRLPDPGEREQLLRYYDAQRSRPGKDETAAWTAVSSILLNLDEFITRE
jgi:mono/diheme cytochrome c family protein